MKYKFDIEENELLDSIEKGEWKSVKESDKEIEQYKLYAKQNLNKDKRVNIRISSRDLELLKLKAIKEGLPYQTFISSILHKYLNGYL